MNRSVYVRKFLYLHLLQNNPYSSRRARWYKAKWSHEKCSDEKQLKVLAVWSTKIHSFYLRGPGFPWSSHKPKFCFDYILLLIKIHSCYITFPSVNLLVTVRYNLMWNNDYSVLETGIYWWATGMSENQQFILEYVFQPKLSNTLTEKCVHLHL